MHLQGIGPSPSQEEPTGKGVLRRRKALRPRRLNFDAMTADPAPAGDKDCLKSPTACMDARDTTDDDHPTPGKRTRSLVACAGACNATDDGGHRRPGKVTRSAARRGAQPPSKHGAGGKAQAVSKNRGKVGGAVARASEAVFDVFASLFK